MDADLPRVQPVSANLIGNTYTYSLQRGARNYELSNHLGNVLTTITDQRKGVDTTGDGIIDYYLPVVVSSQDYYPFGMEMPGRTVSATSYRYGFNGQEKDSEIKGEGNSYYATNWEYDPRVGRRWNIDPIPKSSVSSYEVLGNNPIENIDPSGADWYKNNKSKEFSWFDGSGKHKGYTHMKTGTWSARDQNNKSYYFGKSKNDLIIDYGNNLDDVTVTAVSRKYKTIHWFDGSTQIANLDLEHNSILYGHVQEGKMSLAQALKDPSFADDYAHNRTSLENYYGAEQGYRKMSYAAVGLLASPLAVMGAIETGAVGYIYQGSSWAIRKYGVKFGWNLFKQYAANNGDWSKIDFWDVSFSTANPFSKLGMLGKISTDFINASFDFKNGTFLYVGNNKSVQSFIFDATYNLMKTTIKGNDEIINTLIDVHGGQSKNKLKDFLNIH